MIEHIVGCCSEHDHWLLYYHCAASEDREISNMLDDIHRVVPGWCPLLIAGDMIVRLADGTPASSPAIPGRPG